MPTTKRNLPKNLVEIIDAVSWATTTFRFALTKTGNELRQDIKQLSDDIREVRRLIGTNWNHLPSAVQVEIRTCEIGLDKLKEKI